ncbi:MAG TPA: glycosyltransferase, partial [Blastocatellia bacterium]|nr:glycosyltransferase [Blastocatellia bacterium]
MAAPGVSIVIPTWNGIDLLDRFLPSVTTAALQFKCDTGLPIEIIIVDDASEDGTSEWLENKGFVSITSKQPSSPDSSKSESTFTKVAPQAPERIDQGFIRNSTNLGFGKSCNRGVSAATHKLVFLVNNDVELEPDCIQALTLGFSDASVFAVHCRVFNLETELEVGTGKLCAFGRGFLRVHGSYNYSDKSGRGPSLYSAFAGGGASMYNRNYFLALGGFEDLLS